MLPYFEWRIIELGPLHLQVWGLWAALGFLAGAAAAAWLAKQRGLNKQVVYDLLPWLVLGGLVGGRLGHVFFYAWPYYKLHPAEILYLWEGGLSVYGGFIACTLIGFAYLSFRNLKFIDYADVLIFGLPLGLFFGRIGCFLIHDHPGTVTHFFLGVKYPDGLVRHDHGLYLAINAAVMAIVFRWLARKPRPTGIYLSIFCIWYAIVRFALDFYRVADITYAGLTPAQYLCIVLLGVGVVVGIKTYRSGALSIVDKRQA